MPKVRSSLSAKRRTKSRAQRRPSTNQAEQREPIDPGAEVSAGHFEDGRLIIFVESKGAFSPTVFKESAAYRIILAHFDSIRVPGITTETETDPIGREDHGKTSDEKNPST